jgi:hypothetical protein
MLTHSESNAELSVLRLFIAHEVPDIWYYEDLYLTPDALAPVRDTADELGLERDSFGPAVFSGPLTFRDVEAGRECVQRAAERHKKLFDQMTPLVQDERESLPLPKCMLPSPGAV